MTEPLVDRASALAAEIHADQQRKGSGLPYFDAHLAPVAGLVAAHGGTDTQIAAAYLHDAAEDGEGQVTLDRIGLELGADVAAIVADLSDSLTDTSTGAKKDPWPDRKRAYLSGLTEKPVASLQVSVADKVNNAEAMLADYDDIGEALWTRFDRKQAEYHLWYYGALADVFDLRIPDHPLTGRLNRCLTALWDRVRKHVPDIDRRVRTVAAEIGVDVDPHW